MTFRCKASGIVYSQGTYPVAHGEQRVDAVAILRKVASDFSNREYL
jgi:hypothetical protein